MEVNVLSFATLEEKKEHARLTSATIASLLYLCKAPMLLYLPKQLHFAILYVTFPFLKTKKQAKQNNKKKHKKQANQKKETDASTFSKLIARPGF